MILQNGRRSSTILLEQLTAVEVRPASGWTRLEGPPGRWKISHRLLGMDGLLARLRQVRPDLFAPTHPPFLFRASPVEAGFILLLATAAAFAAWRVWEFVPLLTAVFTLGALLGLGRVAFFLPRRFTVEPGRLTVRHWVGHRVWGKPRSIREDSYAAGGTVFFRMALEYSRARIVLDEGHLLDSLRPRANEVVRALENSPP
jgi:hypothetical protein